MIFITDELGKFEKNIIELAENMGFKECKTIEAIDLFCGISERNDVLKEKDRYYAFIDIPQYWSVRADGLNGAIYDNKTKKANIYFKNPIEKRMVSRVEWIDRNNTVYRIDYYKGSYFFYEQLLADNKENTNLSADLRNVAKLLKESGSYTGALDLNYREFARIYEFVNNVGDRHNHNCYLVMVTMNTLPEQLADIEEIEKALDCMEQSIRSKIRKVDVCTRYSSMQYLIILFEPQENQIPNVMERIFMHYYKLCDREDFKPQYEYIKMTEVK